ncbi:jg5414 [Pararge aegeria aegeria]|uniref:Jg5414 protein n=1 Tax=Pararge aegeria aegeria TaxID=348720 RepID=A0A8S4S8D3_9NEOP|nr:jg5414 [Pararge aegeria aegeria]
MEHSYSPASATSSARNATQRDIRGIARAAAALSGLRSEPRLPAPPTAALRFCAGHVSVGALSTADDTWSTLL